MTALRRKKTVIIVLMVLALAAAVFNVKILYLFQEGNPLPVLWGIIKLEFTDADIVPFAEDKLIQEVGPETPLTNYLAERGWTFKDRLGAGIFYKKDNADLSVEARMFTRYYVVYELEHPL
ncbi:hypothetical protein JOC37_001103 [Desulfohalotomaculum tongense]|uniref:hypothetical protein n=1 Tax=Desulforadius tongensis TaxID=1216062 RepID=UPI00195E31A9|nr:hypothetical protein [Desulforadius tongensis]MBM7854725.1 hypothetical protein [Desulforadius tongensis]